MTRRNTWIVVEGDNGTGKDALAARLVRDGWSFVNESAEVAAALKDAHCTTGDGRYAAFMEANRVAARIAREAGGNSMLVRYWPSTVAGVFADRHVTRSQFTALVQELCSGMPQPDVFLELQCDHTERLSRIELRGPVNGSLDDPTWERADLHHQALRHIASCVTNWNTIDTTGLTPERVYALASGLLNANRL